MTATYLLYAKAGKEFEVTNDLTLIGINAWCGRVIQWRRPGKKRTPEPVEVPALPNYIFATLTAPQFYQAQEVKHISLKMQLVPYTSQRGLDRFRRMTEEAYEEQKRAVRSATLPMPEFDAGAVLQIVGGPFADMVVNFRRVINEGDAMQRKIEAVGPMGSVRLNPLDVKAAE